MTVSIYIALCLTVKTSICYVKLAHTDADTRKYLTDYDCFDLFEFAQRFDGFAACVCLCVRASVHVGCVVNFSFSLNPFHSHVYV